MQAVHSLGVALLGFVSHTNAHQRLRTTRRYYGVTVISARITSDTSTLRTSTLSTPVTTTTFLVDSLELNSTLSTAAIIRDASGVADGDGGPIILTLAVRVRATGACLLSDSAIVDLSAADAIRRRRRIRLRGSGRWV